jgi:hypothetical protein
MNRGSLKRTSGPERTGRTGRQPGQRDVGEMRSALLALPERINLEGRSAEPLTHHVRGQRAAVHRPEREPAEGVVP